MFSPLKTIHIATVILSITGFAIRGVWMLRDSPWLQNKWVKVVPHINDTLLLVAGIVLAVRIQQYPFVHGWLTAKMLALTRFRAWN